MKSMIDLHGMVFASWRVVNKAGNHKGGAALWECVCECGATGVIAGSDLRNGKSKMCKSCAGKLRFSTHALSKTRVYRIYKAMKNRCYNKNSPSYPNYGGRGIRVCEEWLGDFMAFKAWADANGYDDSLSIDRIDNDKGYSPDNCRWATAQTQSENRRFVATDENGKLWWRIAQENGLTSGAYRSRLNYGWPIEKAATTPLGSPLEEGWREKLNRDENGKYC